MQDLPNGGGGGADASIGPRALETLATPLYECQPLCPVAGIILGSLGKVARVLVMLGLHYVPGGHGNHVSGHRGQNGMDVRQRGGTGWAT